MSEIELLVEIVSMVKDILGFVIIANGLLLLALILRR